MQEFTTALRAVGRVIRSVTDGENVRRPARLALLGLGVAGCGAWIWCHRVHLTSEHPPFYAETIGWGPVLVARRWRYQRVAAAGVHFQTTAQSTEVAVAEALVLGPMGSALWIRPGAFLVTFESALGRRTTCWMGMGAAAPANTRFSPDGGGALVEIDDGSWIDIGHHCERIPGDAAWVGDEVVRLIDGTAWFRAAPVATGAWLSPGSGGVAVRDMQGRILATIGPDGALPVDPAVAAQEAGSSRSDPNYASFVSVPPGGACWFAGGRDSIKSVEHPSCLRYADGRVFEHPGWPVDVDVSLVGEQFIDLDTGRPVPFPEWCGERLVVDSWSCDRWLRADGTFAEGICR